MLAIVSFSIFEIAQAQISPLAGNYICCRGAKSLSLYDDNTFVLRLHKLGPNDGLLGTLEKFGKFTVKADTISLDFKGEIVKNSDKGTNSADTLIYKSPLSEKVSIKKNENKQISGLKMGSIDAVLTRKQN